MEHEEQGAVGGFFGPLLQPFADLWNWATGSGESESPAPVAVPSGGGGANTDVFDHYAEEPVGPPAPPPPADGVVYLGINDASRGKESKVFNGMENAHVIDGAGNDPAMQGKTMAADGETVLDLSKEEDVTRFLQESGVGNRRVGADGERETPEQAQARIASMQDLFLGAKGENGERSGGLDAGVRDEMAEFVQVLQRVENGEVNMDRLVMSGHSTGEWVYSEAEGSPGVTFEQMGQLMSQFPQAQGGVEDFMLSACHTLEDGAVMDNRDGQQYREIFPNLDSVWGYNGYSPSYKQGSARHIGNWLQASKGDNPQAVANMARRTGQNATSVLFE